MGGVIDIDNTATEIVLVIVTNELLIDVVHIQDEGRQVFALSVVNLEFEELVKHWVAVVLYDVCFLFL